MEQGSSIFESGQSSCLTGEFTFISKDTFVLQVKITLTTLRITLQFISPIIASKDCVIIMESTKTETLSLSNVSKSFLIQTMKAKD